MGSTKEIKFQDCCGDLVGCQNGMKFIIRTEPGMPASEPAHWVTVCSESEKSMFSTMGRQYFSLTEAKRFCQRIAAGEVSLADLRAQYDAEELDELQAIQREKAEDFRDLLATAGLHIQDFLWLEMRYRNLGDVGRQYLLAAMRRESRQQVISRAGRPEA